jgi:Family of unknown function (DUF6519)/Right handed beta helix region
MQGDYSRFTFDQRKHYNGVLVQQGRVQLDADANEQGAIQAHRDRTEAVDTIGPCGAPKRGGGFRILPLRPGVTDLGICAGRMYVEGLLCEVGGNPIPITADPTGNQVELATLDADGSALKVGEWVELSSRTRPAAFFQVTQVDAAGRRLTLHTTAGVYKPADGAVARRAVTYATQPDHPGAPALAPVAGDRLLLYLDVWERHVTAVEDPTIREVALGGPDTTARLQTVCQVKFHTEKVSDQLTCDDPVPDWPPAASDGRATATDTEPTTPPGPCRIAPDGGFRGLENRLYRVEIHGSGDLDKATFKWSRDNGAVVFAVEEILDQGGNRVRVRRLGRDDVLTLHDQDWVEVLDDAIELSGNPGVLARVSNVNQLDRTLTLTPPVPQLDPKGHPRLRRWDVPTSDDNGHLPAKTPTELEHGIQVTFSGANFQTGDWWTIPARTLSGKAGPLTDSPPQGITHHYCRLALVKWEPGNAGLEAKPTDCRPEFPPLTAIEATDVGYDDRLCKLTDDADVLAAALVRPVTEGPVDNLQEAVDVLCARDATYQQLAYVAGDGQEGPPSTELPVQPTVVVRNAIGEPVQGVRVTFTPDGQGGVPQFAATTGSTGEASLPWTLGPAVGLNKLVAELRPPQGVPQQVRFNARGSAPPAAGGGLCSITVGDGVRSHGQFNGAAGLQAAVDMAIAAGGATICVLPGLYLLPQAIFAARAQNLAIHGSRLETVVRANSKMAFGFLDCANVELSDLRVLVTEVAPETDPDGLVRFRNCNGVTVQRCNLAAVSVRRPEQPVSSCLLLEDCRGAVVVRDNVLATADPGRLGGIMLRRTEGAELRGNTVRVLSDGGHFGVDLDDGCTGCRVVDNAIEGLQPAQPNVQGALGGVHIGSGCHDAVVRGNRIDGGVGLGVALGSVAADFASLGGMHGLEIDDNTISRMAAGGVGLIGWRISAEAPITDRLALRGNRVEACSYGQAPVLIPSSGPAIPLAGAVVLFMGEGMRLLDNDLSDNDRLRNAPDRVPGLFILNPGEGLSISRNRIRNNGFGGAILAGSSAADPERPVVTISGNEVVAPVGPALIVSGGGGGNMHVTGNHLRGEGTGRVVVLRNGGAVQCTDNHIISHLAQAGRAVEVSARHVTFDANHCLCPRALSGVQHVLLEASGSVSATGNRVLETSRQAAPSLHLSNPAGTNGTLVAVANLTTSGVQLDQTGADVANLAGILP